MVDEFPRYMVLYINQAGFPGAKFYRARDWMDEDLRGEGRAPFDGCAGITRYVRIEQDWKPIEG